MVAALGPKEVIAKLAEMWRGCSDADKAVSSNGRFVSCELRDRLVVFGHFVGVRLGRVSYIYGARLPCFSLG